MTATDFTMKAMDAFYREGFKWQKKIRLWKDYSII